jgi:hypothetical protein
VVGVACDLLDQKIIRKTAHPRAPLKVETPSAALNECMQTEQPSVLGKTGLSVGVAPPIR